MAVRRGGNALLRWSAVTLLFLALLAAQSWATYRLFTSRFPGGNDFYSRWSNGCALVWTGENPYSEEVARRTQIGIYGRPARPGEDLAAFSYPLYAFLFFWPLCYVRPYPLVQAIWMTLMLYGLLAGAVLTARAARWRPPAWLWGATLVWAVLNYPHARALILGQMATLVFLATAASLWALAKRRDGWGGALLAVTTLKPQMCFLLVPWVLWWAAWRRRWGVWKGFGLTMALLVVVSLLLVPTWPADFVAGVRNYDVVSATSRHSLTWIVTRELMGLGPVVEAVITGALILYALAESWRWRRAGWGGFLWTTGLLLILTNFVAPRTATTHYTMLLIPLFAWFARLSERSDRWAAPVAGGIEAALLVGQWVLFAATLQHNPALPGAYEGAMVYLPTPILLLVVQALSRPSRAGEEEV